MKEGGKRRQKQIDKKQADKRLVALLDRRDSLRAARSGMQLVELPKPVRAGYKKFFVLRQDVANGPDVKVYRQVLHYIQNTVYSRNRDFQTKDYKTKTMVPMPHSVKAIPHKDWNTLVAAGTFTARQQDMFMKVWKPTNPKNPKVGYFHYEFQKAWAFVEKIEPHYKTHSLLLDPDLESELDRISNKFDRDNMWPRIGKLLGWKSDNWDRDEARNRIIEKYYSEMARNILEYNGE